MRTKLRSKFTLLLVVCAALLAVPAIAMAITADPSGNTSPAPTIQSDKDDYTPGSTVNLTGSNWQPGESVHINVNDDQGQTWSRDVDVTADASGNITDQFQLPNWFVATYKVTATGAQSGVATTSFTDGNVSFKGPGVASPAPASWTVNYTTHGGGSTTNNTCAVPPAGTAGSKPITPGNTGTASVGISNKESMRLGTVTVPAGSTLVFDHWTDQNGNTVANNACLSGDPSAGANGNITDLIAHFKLANQAPVANNDSLTTNEDTAGNVNVLTNDTDANGDTLTVTANTNGANGSASCTTAGVCTYTPNGNFNGSDSFTYTVSDSKGGTATGTVNVTVTAVNDAPSFDVPASAPAVNEDAGAQTVSNFATNISAGPANESTQTVSFPNVTNNNNSLFTAGGQPAISSNGTLTYTPAANANGTATVSVQAQDSGGTANGGVDTSATKTFTITVNGVNDAPSFTKGANQTVNEDAGAQTVNGWATAISAGPNESSQTVQFIVTNDNNGLFTTGGQPAVDASGKLTYTPAADKNGSATVTIKAKDSGGTGNGGVDESAEQTFTITVNSVNDAPSFTAGANQTVDEDSGAHSVAWATAISKGPANESGQELNFVVTNDNNSLFSNQPAIADDGTLSYTLADNANGTATVSVTLHDDGGTANGGDDTSETKTFTITVNSVNDAPVVTFTDPAGNTQTLDEDKTTTRLYKYTVTDVDNANPTVTESCGSGGSLKLDETGDPAQNSFRCLFADDATTTTVSATANDGEASNNTGSDSIAVTVNNVAPKVNLTGANTANEGDTKTYSFTITDPGADTFNFPAGYPTCGLHGNLVGTPAITDGQFQCTFPDGDNFTDVAVKVADDDGGVSVADTEHVEIITVEVANVAPSVTAAANQSSKEGESKLFSLGSFSDPGTDSPWAVDVDWGDGSTHTTFTETATGPATAQVITAKSHTYADEGTGTYTVTVKVTDKNGVSDTKTFPVNVSNENPTASNPTFVFNPVLGTATAGFDFSDAGYLDTHSASYFTWSDVGDRPASVTAQENVAPDATGKASDTRTLTPGCYPNLSVTGTAKDNDGGTSAPLTLYSSAQTSVYSNTFRPPIMDNERNIAKYGNVVPVKVQLTNPCTGGTVTSESLFITLAKGAGNEAIEDTNVIATSVSSADSGSQMRIADGGYMFNLSTKNLSANSDWTVRVRLGSTTGPVLLQAVLYPKK